MRAKKRGRPFGTKKGFKLESQKWGVAFILRQILIAHKMPADKVVTFVFALYVDVKKAQELVTVTRDNDGRIIFEVQATRRERQSGKSYRIDLKLQGGTSLDRNDFAKSLRDIAKDALPFDVENQSWFEKVSQEVMLAGFGSTPEIKGYAWQTLKRIAPRAVLPACEPLEASIPPYDLLASIVGHQISDNKPKKSIFKAVN